jgi:predicted phage terminase large subunit-like protein
MTEEERFAALMMKARTDFLSYMRVAWQGSAPFRIGRHTRAICDRLTRAVDDYLRGQDTHILCNIPHRHGKSTIISKYFPSWFLGRCAKTAHSVIMSGYGSDLVTGFSRECKAIMRSTEYRVIFPGVTIDPRHNAVDDWALNGSSDPVTVVGLGGGLAGKGGNLIVLDDAVKNAKEAGSATYREATWQSFSTDLMTRKNAPAVIVVVLMTQWHVDDITGRILRRMKENPDFPQFERLVFPARKDGPDGWECLFPEQYTPKWYAEQRATLGTAKAAALLDCNPVVEGGNRFACNKIVFHDTLEGWPTGREARGWDLASSSKDRDKDDPDRTWGIRGLVKSRKLSGGAVLRELWIRSMTACRAEAPQRNAMIRATAQADGTGIAQHVEAFAGYKDAYTELKAALPGHIVRPSRLPGDKSAKLAPLEPVMENGDVHVYRPGCGPWLDEWLAEFMAFPAGAHDDACDATAVLFHSFDSGGSTILF